MKDRVEILESFSWAALVAIKMAWREGKITSNFSEHVFIMSWLATARKRKLFPRSVSSEIDWLINDGREKGHHTGLRTKLEYIYSTCQKDISGQAAYFRFTRVMEMLKNEGWKGYMLTPAKWKALKRESFGGRENLIFMNEEEIKISFNSNGGLIRALELRVSGDIKMAETIFENNHLPVRTELQDGDRYYFYLQPERESVVEKR
ncbi:hypothetical protein R545_22525 [Salmonella enterica subsp. diarizonae serovar Rough:r:z]|uniref:DUF2913 family protein n=1 Tax=Salmonella enterica subsp. diarizonae serovar Rough:r:z TaxID=1974321 RepID=A0A7Z0Y1H9_SALDZ|nr:DUF2913 family protein [Salmonella enterica]EEJ6656549.1 DUF2913 family protein [Salmonella enterica subsp. enterica serovar Redlands]OSG80350.1 hypothetical protein R545_22525 [Salmonella enterica subsp. diarizonae serovar Rough:r:z]